VVFVVWSTLVCHGPAAGRNYYGRFLCNFIFPACHFANKRRFLAGGGATLVRAASTRATTCLNRCLGVQIIHWMFGRHAAVSEMAKSLSGAPQFVKYFGPVLDALHQLVGSGRPDEVRSLIAQKLGFSEQEQSEPLPSKAKPRFDN
jgi:Mrr N-terminal domain